MFWVPRRAIKRTLCAETHIPRLFLLKSNKRGTQNKGKQQLIKIEHIEMEKDEEK